MLKELPCRREEKTDFAGELQNVYENIVLHNLSRASDELRNCPKIVYCRDHKLKYGFFSSYVLVPNITYV